VRVRVNLSELRELEEKAKTELGGVTEQLKQVVALGAAFERLSHGYHNRSGQLEASTHERVVRSTARLSQVDLEMGYQPNADYASYIVGRGLSRISEAARNVEEELRERFEGMAYRLAG
jgi:hypothetical protein